MRCGIVPRWSGSIALVTGLVVLLLPACGGGGTPSEPSCVNQGAAVAVQMEPPGASNCSVGNTPFVRVTNNTCSSLTVNSIDETLVGLDGPCAGMTAEFGNAIGVTLAQGQTQEFELFPWEWCFPGPPAFNCQLREDVVVTTSQGDFTASSSPFRVFYNAQCPLCSAPSITQGSQLSGESIPLASKDESAGWMR